MDEDYSIVKAVTAVIAVFLGIAVCCFILNDVPREDPADAQPTYTLQLDCTNAAQMHAYGLPTKADVMEWHMQGQWGYVEPGNRLHMYAELPGGKAKWDELYGIDPDNPAFDK